MDPQLKAGQEQTLASPRLHYGWLASMLFVGMDLVYGKKRTLSKFKVLEIIARVPYQAWENVAYVAMTHTFAKPDFARRIFEFVKKSREQQDNEQWHLLILEELVHKNGIKEGYVRYRVLPQIVAFAYYHISWLLYVIKPRLSYELNAHFEDHAEHEYMEFVRDTPDLLREGYQGEFKDDYGSFDSLAELFIRIGLDERHHKEESLESIEHARFGD